MPATGSSRTEPAGSFNSIRESERNTLVERVGRQLRAMMSWLNAK